MKIKRITRLTVLVAVMLSTTSCLKSIVKSTIEKEPIANKIALHSNPRKGDYAIYKVVPSSKALQDPTAKMLQGETTVEIKITDVKNGLFVLQQKTKTTMVASSFMNDLVFEMYCDKSGNIKKAVLIDKSSGERKNLKIAAPGEKNYNMLKTVSRAEMSKYGIPSSVKTSAGNFSVSDAASNNAEKNPENGFVIYVMNNKVKFKHIASFAVYKNSDSGEVESSKNLVLVEQGRK